MLELLSAFYLIEHHLKNFLIILFYNTDFYAQLIDDSKGITLASASTVNDKNYSGNIEAAKKLGHTFGKKIKELKIKEIVFDRSGYIYHGKVKSFAEAIREEGVKF